ncbi:MAG TPA: M28 family peptidase [Anaerolineae bacterium]|nr:M28 family peptidase [Anaerolineae bacterium]
MSDQPTDSTISAITPVPPQQRVNFVDALRGFALFGVLTMNMLFFAGYPTNPANWGGFNRYLLITIHFFGQAKFYSLFSLLFGWGLSLQLTSFLPHQTDSNQTKKRWRVLRRLFLLLLIGAFHYIFIWEGDILLTYALLGFVLILFANRSPRFLLISALLGLLLTILLVLPTPFMESLRQTYHTQFPVIPLGTPLYQDGTYLDLVRWRATRLLSQHSTMPYTAGYILAMFLLGLYIGKRQFFRHPDQHPTLRHTILIISLIIGLIANTIFVANMFNPSWVPAGYGRFVNTTSRSIGAVALMLFYTTSFITLWHYPRPHHYLRQLAPVGRMALTNYLTQSLFFTFFFYHYGLRFYRQIDPTFGMIITILFFWLQIRFSHWWLSEYQFGPAEWLWRTLTYGQRQPWRRGAKAPPPISRRTRLTAALLLLLTLGATTLYYFRPTTTTLGRNPNSAPPFIPPTPTNPPPTTTPQPIPPTPTPIATPAATHITYNPNNPLANNPPLPIAASFNITQALAHIAELSGPPYNGRYAAAPGGLAAGDYIAAQFAQFNLQPAAPNNSFFQPFPITYTLLATTPQLAITTANGQTHHAQFHTDFAPIIRQYMGPGRAQGDLVWLNRCTHDDFGRLDITAKIIICHTDNSRNNMLAVSRDALAHGAAALLFLTDPVNRPPDFGEHYFPPWVPEPIPTTRIYPTLLATILADSGHTLASLTQLNDILPLTSQATINIETVDHTACPANSCLARNVLGVLPGRDPNFADEIIIIGAHYDHMGTTPDNTHTWWGANDDASGVALMLTLAQTWAEQGYAPRRTILFAAWDAEEHGLLGAYHYTRYPSYPHQNVVALLQLDMIGAGAAGLSLDGHPLLNAHLQRNATYWDTPPATIINLGRSDHVPFLEAGVPASLLIWWDIDNTLPHYHRPLDTIDIIEPDKLKTAGQLVHHTILDLAEHEPTIRALLADRATSANQRDQTNFLATAVTTQQPDDQQWWTDLQTLDAYQLNLTPNTIQIQNDYAISRLRLNIAYSPTLTTTAQINTEFTAGFRYTTDGWKWDGPALAWHQQDNLRLGYSVDTQTNAAKLATDIHNLHTRLNTTLGLTPTIPTTLILLPDNATLRATTSPLLPTDQTVWIEPGLIKLVATPNITKSQALTNALLQLTLANNNLTVDNAPWLWHGLPLVWQTITDTVTTQSRYIPPLQTALETDAPLNADLQAWAATRYLQQQLDWPGLGRLITTLGQNCPTTCSPTQTDALITTNLNLDTPFPTSWRTHWQTQLATAQNNLDTLLATRRDALFNNNPNQFLATLATDPALREAEQYWFDAITATTIQSYTVAAQPITFFDDGSLLATITTSYRLQDGDQPLSNAYTQQLQIETTPAGYRWAGRPNQTFNLGPITVRYPPSLAHEAPLVADQALTIYTHFATELRLNPNTPLTIELFADRASFATSIDPRFPNNSWVTGWTAPQQAIKLRRDQAGNLQQDLITQIGRHLLLAEGITTEWLLRGVTSYLATPFDPSFQQNAALTLHDMGHEFQPAQLLIISPPHQQSRSSASQDDALAWDAVRYLIHTHGWDTLLAIIDAGGSTNQALGLPLNQFAINWHISLTQQHRSPSAITLANQFDTQQAQRHLNFFTAPAQAGRLAGSPGNQATIDYISQQFAQIGLQPWGDPATNQYQQTFPISYTTISRPPRLELTTTAGDLITFSYRLDFLVTHAITTNIPLPTAPLFVVDNYQGLDLNGAIALRLRAGNLADEINQAVAANAGGLIIITNKNNDDELWAKTPFLPTAPIPVFELTRRGNNKLRDLLGLLAITDRPTNPLNLTANLQYAVTPPRTVNTANVIALWPGQDPYLSQELLIISAHHDHVGDDPYNVRYDGANDDAAGVAALLEIARLWAANDYQPRRSVLFVAWGAQEQGQIGSNYYVNQPTWPLSDTIGIIQLDGIANGDGFYPSPQGDWAEDAFLLAAAEQTAAQLEQRISISIDPLTRPSDQLAFAPTNIPAILYSWRLPNEDNLPTHLALPPETDTLTTSGTFITLLLSQLAR